MKPKLSSKKNIMMLSPPRRSQKPYRVVSLANTHPCIYLVIILYTTILFYLSSKDHQSCSSYSGICCSRASALLVPNGIFKSRGNVSSSIGGAGSSDGSGVRVISFYTKLNHLNTNTIKDHGMARYHWNGNGTGSGNRIRRNLQAKHTSQMSTLKHHRDHHYFENRLMVLFMSRTRGSGSHNNQLQLHSAIPNSSSFHDDDNNNSSSGSNHNSNDHKNHKRKETQQYSSSSSSSTSSTATKIINRKVTLSILSILTATTLNLLGFTMTSPLTPTLGKHFSLPTGASFGSLTSAYPLGMLFGLFTWPRLSDYMGRKKIMILSLFGSSLGLGLQSYCIFHYKSLKLFLLSRIVTGVFSGCAPVAKAYLADVGDKSGKLAMYLAWRDAASTLAYILGPVCGGILFESLRRRFSSVGTVTATATATAAGSSVLHGQSNALGCVIGVSALGSLLAAIIILSFVDDKIGSKLGRVKTSSKANDNTQKNYNINRTSQDDDSDDEHQQNDNVIMEEDDDEYEIIACPLGMKLWTGVATVCIVSFLYHVADSTFFAFFPALLQNQLHMDARQIGLVFTMLSCITFSFSATSVSSKLISRIGVVNTCALGLGAVSAGLGALSVAASSFHGIKLPFLIIAAAGLYFCGVPLYGPTIPTMLLQCVPPYQRGAVMGLDGMINTVARIGSPIIMGDIYRRLGASMAFGVASVAVLSSSAIALIRRQIVLRDQRKMAES